MFCDAYKVGRLIVELTWFAWMMYMLGTHPVIATRYEIGNYKIHAL
jgi:hypothetical protein